MNNKNCFDFLRIFFCANILFSHLAELSQSKSLAFIFSYVNASLGVQGFFVISGFLVAKSYTNTPSLKQYFIKRAKRILPAYFFVILSSTIVLSVFSSYNYSDYFSNISTYKYFGWNLIFMNFVHPCLPGLFDNNLLCAVNGALWTLKVEEGFYVVLPLIFYIIAKSKKPTLILATIYILSLIYWFVMQFYFNKPLFAKQLPGYLSYFAVGIFLFLNFKSFLKHKSKFLILSIAAITVSSIFPQNFDILYPAAFGSIVLLAAYNLPFLNNFGKYGDFTYGLYIFHFPIIQLFRFYNLFERFNPFLMAIFIIIITFIFALFSWFFIEKRFLDRYKSLDKTVLT